MRDDRHQSRPSLRKPRRKMSRLVQVRLLQLLYNHKLQKPTTSNCTRWQRSSGVVFRMPINNSLIDSSHHHLDALEIQNSVSRVQKFLEGLNLFQLMIKPTTMVTLKRLSRQNQQRKWVTMTLVSSEGEIKDKKLKLESKEMKLQMSLLLTEVLEIYWPNWLTVMDLICLRINRVCKILLNYLKSQSVRSVR